MNLISYEWIENEDTGKRTMVVTYEVADRTKSIPVKKIATIIEAMLPEVTASKNNGQEVTQQA